MAWREPPTLKWKDGQFTLTYGGVQMIVNPSETASNAMLDALGEKLNGGSVELLADDGMTLARLQLSDPAAKPADGAELEFARIAETTAIAQGDAEIAILFSAEGLEMLSVDVGEEDSDAVMKFNRTTFDTGDPVRITSFRLAMPS